MDKTILMAFLTLICFGNFAFGSQKGFTDATDRICAEAKHKHVFLENCPYDGKIGEK